MGVIADVSIRQVYRNSGDHVMEAVYVFPGSTGAAVYGMEMRIGERRLRAKIEERDQARRAYEAAAKEGKSASLLEQRRPNAFQMNVGNMLPGDRIEVLLRYTERLVPDSGTYSFVYPTVVGPRYRNQPDSSPDGETWVANPYLREGEDSPSAFRLRADLSAALACFHGLTWRPAIGFAAWTGLLILAANVVRAGLLFPVETGLWPSAPGVHRGIGVGVFALMAACLAGGFQRFWNGSAETA